MRLLPRLEPIIASAPPKLVIGFSDITALGCLLWKYGVPWLHAPLLTSVAYEPDETRAHALSIAAGDGRFKRLVGETTIRPGRCDGRLVGGSLSLLSAMVGTPYMPDLTDPILFIEDIGEKAYRLDRMWQQLLLAGCLRGVAGVVLGYLTKCDEGLEVMSELISALNVPAARGFGFGHEAPNWAVPFGGRAAFDADSKSVVFESEIVIP